MTFADDLLEYLANSPTAIHAVEESVRRLAAAGFVEKHEGDAWTPAPGEAFFVRRGRASLAAAIVGAAPPAEAGFRIVGAHTDAPALRLKPNAVYVKEGCAQLGVEVYGGPLLATWTDRDLALAGFIIANVDFGAPQVIPVRLTKPVCRIPNVAIHLNRKANDDGLKLDRQKHLPAIFGFAENEEAAAESLGRALADAAGVDPATIADFGLDLVDAQPPSLGGLDDDLLFARGLDNLISCHAALAALSEVKDEAVGPTRVVALFDSEEVGSRTYRGADSTMLDNLLERLCFDGAQSRENLLRALARSILVSADGAHAVHPNYADLHDPRHKPRLGGGPAVKVSAAERYATTAATRAYLALCAEAAEVPLQRFVQRSDLAGGATIGPISATRLGAPTVDVGAPMLAMHSIRETAAPADCEMLKKLLAAHLGAQIDAIE